MVVCLTNGWLYVWCLVISLTFCCMYDVIEYIQPLPFLHSFYLPWTLSHGTWHKRKDLKISYRVDEDVGLGVRLGRIELVKGELDLVALTFLQTERRRDLRVQLVRRHRELKLQISKEGLISGKVQLLKCLYSFIQS